MLLDDHTYVLVRRVARAIGGVAYYVAFRGARVLDRPAARRGRRTTIGALGAAIGAGGLASALLLFAVCGGPAPGESDGARSLRAASAPVIAALATYASEHGGQYPAALDMLVPRYLAAGALPLRPVQPEFPVEYRVDSAGYALRFAYTGPGMNNCEYRPTAGQWRCGGFW